MSFWFFFANLPSLVNTVDEKKDKLSAYEKSFFTQEDGSIGCTCARRVAPSTFKKSFFEKAYDLICKKFSQLSPIKVQGQFNEYLPNAAPFNDERTKNDC